MTWTCPICGARHFWAALTAPDLQVSFTTTGDGTFDAGGRVLTLPTQRTCTVVNRITSATLHSCTVKKV